MIHPMTDPPALTWTQRLGPLTPEMVLAELHRQRLHVSQWSAEVWRTQTTHDPAGFIGLTYDDFVALIEWELLFAAHG